ncbi:MAG: hypothetical protein LBB25_04150 [Holosporaceae bacterium]|jgi:hypothetical protein|nr:hypothetical protein [Holosporaceae bacterium]
MANEVSSIIEEINEELKNDQLLAFLKKHKNIVLVTISISVIGILAYSSWYIRKMEQKEEITNALLNELQFSTRKDSSIIDGLIENAPAELKPFLLIIKSGKQLSDFKDMLKNADALLSLPKKHGVDQMWKDLAVIIYVSYRLKSADELIKLLEPLAEKNRPFRFTALELLAMNYKTQGDYDKAQENLKKIIKDNEAPNTMKKRVGLLLSHMKNSLEKK